MSGDGAAKSDDDIVHVSSPTAGGTKTTATTTTTTESTTTKTNYWIVGSYLTILTVWVASQFILIPYVVHLLVLVTAILYAACHASLVLLQEHHAEVPEGETKPERDTMKKEDAYQFPLVGSLSLFSLYLAFKYLDKDLVNLLIGFYFGVVGCFAVAMTIAPLFSKIIPIPKLSADIEIKQQILHPFGDTPWEGSIMFSIVEILALFVSAGICYFYFQEKAWYLNNVLGIAFCLQGIERFSLGTYKIGAILLIGLFFYDIFWVFATEVMVSVAKNLDGPIKILFPRSFEISEETGKMKDLSLLGLGDIVIPGFFLSLLLRFDAHTAATKANKKYLEIHDSFPKPYFHSALLAYVLGLSTTLFVMIQFNAAQPALLYLVPACLGSSFLCAMYRGEVKHLLDYSEEEEAEEETKEEQTTEETKKND